MSLWPFAGYWWRKLQSTLVFLPGESHVQRSLASCSPWGRKELDTTEVTQHTRTLGTGTVQISYTVSFPSHWLMELLSSSPMFSAILLEFLFLFVFLNSIHLLDKYYIDTNSLADGKVDFQIICIFNNTETETHKYVCQYMWG